MTTKILRDEIVAANGGQLEIETRGELYLMPRNAQSVFAHFGMFERTDHSTLFYSVGTGDDFDARDLYIDDLAALRAGNVGICEKRAPNPAPQEIDLDLTYINMPG